MLIIRDFLNKHFVFKPKVERQAPPSFNQSELLSASILRATITDDWDLLQDIASWLEENKVPAVQYLGTNTPMLYACLRNFTKCITVLYTLGYRVSLAKEDEENINKIMMGTDSEKGSHYSWEKYQRLFKRLETYDYD